MLKNPTPKQIALFTGLYICLLVTVVGMALLGMGTLGLPKVVIYVLGPVAVFLAAYWVTIYYLKKYIYRKIKLIYKTIHKHKRSPEEKTNSIDVESDIIGEVEKEVEEWALTREAEINKHIAWAEYRRTYIGDISHELKTPIFNIQGYLHTLLDGALYDDKINHSFLKRAAKNVERLHTIVEDLSAISRLESGNLVLDPVSFDIKELAQEVFEDLEIKAAQKDITISFKEGADHNFTVRADIDSTRQILTNLLHNSIKYGKAGGRTKIGFYDMESNILIEVADNGIGIPKEHLDHVFDRFYRVDKSRSRAQGGSGLGLSIVKHIIDAHKQTINVRSATNLGSTFGFTLEKA
jgi:two-component system phosphate regulon sensor histidine kinase PhoR